MASSKTTHNLGRLARNSHPGGKSTRPLVAGIVGTFDVSNFGDLLFPLIAQHELRKRLAGAQVNRYSYREMTKENWPFSVRSLERLPSELPGLDLLLVGGGHLIRFDKEVAPGYFPTRPEWHHPTSYWLMPTLLALSSGVPVIWNGVGVSSDTPQWARPLLATALREAAYISVRDTPSASELKTMAGDAAVEIIPDTAFGIRALLPANPSEAFRAFCSRCGLKQPYVVLQASPQLKRFQGQLALAVSEARARGCEVLEMPISPILGDACGLLDLQHPPLRPQQWPHPLLLAEIIANAEAVIAQSLHLSIAALASGVPVHRPLAEKNTKYAALEAFQGVHAWDQNTDATVQIKRGLGRRAPEADVLECVARLDAHWDRVAKLAGSHSPSNMVAAAAFYNLCVSMAEETAGRLQKWSLGSLINGSRQDRPRDPEPKQTLDPSTTMLERIGYLEGRLEALAQEHRQLSDRFVGQQGHVVELQRKAESMQVLENDLRKTIANVRDQLQAHDAYFELIARIRSLVRESVPADAAVLVVSRGDDQLVSLDGARGSHFPQDDSGTYSGRHPHDSEEAIAALEKLRAKGSQYLLLPQTAFWWLESYPAFKQHLETHYRVLRRQEDTALLFSLIEAKANGATFKPD